MKQIKNLIGELKRRRVFRAALIYVAVAWVVLQAADIVLPALNVPEWGIGLVMGLLGLGLPIALVLAWAYQVTPERSRKNIDFRPKAELPLQQDVDTSTVFSVGEWKVDPTLHQLTRNGKTLILEPRVMDVLVYLVEHAGKVVTGDQLVADVWKGTIVGDSPIYQNFAKLRRALGDDRRTPRFIETIPKRGYRLIAAVRQVSPEPAVRQSQELAAVRSPFVSPALMMILAGSYFFLATSDVATPRVRQVPAVLEVGSIAVMPFVDLSNDHSQEYLGDGIADELLHTLSNLPGVRVIARSSSFSFKGKNEDVISIGEKLNVETVLEGSVRKSGDRLRITAQLVDVSDGYPIWSKSFERKVGDVFAVQDEIASSVARSLKLPLNQGTMILRVATQNAEAYQQYLFGKYHLNKRRPDDLDKALGYFHKARDLDPDYALAYAGIADTYFLLADKRYGPIPQAEAVERAEEAIQKSLVLDDRLAEAYVTLANIREVQGNFSSAQAAAQRALELNPNYAPGYRAYALTTSTPALFPYQRAVELDPLSPTLHADLGFAYYRVNQLAEAEKEYEFAVQLDPAWHVSYVRGSYFFLERGRPDKAISWAKKALSLESGQSKSIHGVVTSANRIARAYVALGDHETGRMWLDYTQSLSEPPWIQRNDRIQSALAQAQFAEAHALLEEGLSDLNQMSEEVSWGHFLHGYIVGAMYEMMMAHDDHALAYFERVDYFDRTYAVHEPNYECALSCPPPPDGTFHLLFPHNFAFGELPFDSLFMLEYLRWGYLPAVNRAHLFLRKDATAQGHTLLDKSIEYLQAVDQEIPGLAGAHYVRASIYALRGERDKALSELRMAINKGWLKAWYAEHDPNLDSLRDDPEFQTILADLNNELTSMLERVRQAESSEEWHKELALALRPEPAPRAAENSRP